MSQAASELELVRRIAAGEQHLFAGIIDRHSGLVAAAVLSQGIAPADVEDVAQLCFINVYKGLAGFRGDAKLSSWIYRIAVNTARAQLRRQSRRISARSVEEAMESGREPIDNQASRGALQTVQQRALAGALARIAATERACLSLFYFEELSYEEISQAMSLNINTVRTHIRRGKLRLAELLDAGLIDDTRS